jgi:hypothetical protein
MSGLFPPRKTMPQLKWKNKGKQAVSYSTVNGRVEMKRTVYWNQTYKSIVPLDKMLGIDTDSHSRGVREICCRESINNAFIKASDNIDRLAQITISHESVRKIVETAGAKVSALQHKVAIEPEFAVEDCIEQTLITGTDGVMVPLVTEVQKINRRKTEPKKRKEQNRKSCAKACRPRKGSDGVFKVFKIACFYSKDKEQQYVMGTGGNLEVIGRVLRKMALKLGIDRARLSYSVSDGAVWIDNNYSVYLPMLEHRLLHCHHFKVHLVELSQLLFGMENPDGLKWKDMMYKTDLENGSMVLLHKLNDYTEQIKTDEQQKAYDSFYKYISKRIDMTDYPLFLAKGMDIGSGPTESFCKSLTARLKGSGMRWDKDSAQAIMSLAALYANNQWKQYWGIAA